MLQLWRHRRLRIFSEYYRTIQSSLLCLQETWLFDSNSGLLEKKLSNEYNAQFPAHMLQIRHHTGDHQLELLSWWTFQLRRILNLFHLQSKTIYVVECSYSDIQIIMLSLKMLCDMQFNSICEYLDVLNELELLLYWEEYDESLLTGDWNADFNRNVANHSFPTELKLYISDNKTLISKSMINHVIVLGDGSLSQQCEPIVCINGDSNLSGHMP